MESAQVLFEVVHLKTAVDPTTSPVIPDTFEVGVVIVAAPETKDQAPNPTAGFVAAIVVVVVLQRF